MANLPDSQKLSEAIALLVTNIESLSKQINRQSERLSHRDDLLRKITKQLDTHDQALEKLTAITKKLEIAYEERNHELKRLVNGVKAYAYSKTVHTDIRPEVTDDESTQYTAKTTHENASQMRLSRTNRTEGDNLQRTNNETFRSITYRENGINNTRVEEFIESKIRTYQSKWHRFPTTHDSNEEITDRAKQSIRFYQITSYEELYATLRTQVSPIPSTISGSRNKMQNIKQGIHETAQSYSNRFRQALNELEYAIKAKHSNSTARNLILKEENAEAVRFYVLT